MRRAVTPHKCQNSLAHQRQATPTTTRSYASQTRTITFPPALTSAKHRQLRRAATPHERRIDLPTSADDCQATPIMTRSYASQVQQFTDRRALRNARYDAQLRLTNAYSYRPTSADVRQASPITTRSCASQAPNLTSRQRQGLPSNANCDAQLRPTSATIYRPTRAKRRQLRRAVTHHKRVH